MDNQVADRGELQAALATLSPHLGAVLAVFTLTVLVQALGIRETLATHSTSEQLQASQLDFRVHIHTLYVSITV
jgi:hypothetical protein